MAFDWNYWMWAKITRAGSGVVVVAESKVVIGLSVDEGNRQTKEVDSWLGRRPGPPWGIGGNVNSLFATVSFNRPLTSVTRPITTVIAQSWFNTLSIVNSQSDSRVNTLARTTNAQWIRLIRVVVVVDQSEATYIECTASNEDSMLEFNGLIANLRPGQLNLSELTTIADLWNTYVRY